MNRSSNVLNSSPLGSGGKSLLSFVTASLVCKAVCTAAQTMGKQLKAHLLTKANTAVVLRAGRVLKSASQPNAVVFGLLGKRSAVYVAAAGNISVATTAVLSRLRMKKVSAACLAQANTVAVLRSVRKITLAAICSAQATSLGILSRYSRKYLAIPGFGQVTYQAKLTVARRLKASVTAQCDVIAYLNESTRSRASAERTIILPFASRTVIVPKGK